MSVPASQSSTTSPVVCIVGMHRSGTSLITEILQRAGLYLGAEQALLGANGGNPDGHFEHLGFLELNDALLQHWGGSWDYPPGLPSGWQQAETLEPLKVQARALLHTFDDHALWGWKDPRTALLLPFWRELIGNLRFVICMRSPLAVAQSLHARNNIEIPRGASLWQLYMRAALAGSLGGPRLLVCYDHLLTFPEREVARLVEFCGLPANPDLPRCAAAVRSELRHQSSDDAALLNSDFIAREAKLLYLALRGLAAEDKRAAAPLAETHDAIADLLQLLEATVKDPAVTGLQARLSQAESELAKLRAEIWREAKTNHRWAYRFYRKVLRPFQLARIRSSH